jgi:hypothetical protein
MKNLLRCKTEQGAWRLAPGESRKLPGNSRSRSGPRKRAAAPRAQARGREMAAAEGFGLRNRIRLMPSNGVLVAIRRAPRPFLGGANRDASSGNLRQIFRFLRRRRRLRKVLGPAPALTGMQWKLTPSPVPRRPMRLPRPF